MGDEDKGGVVGKVVVGVLIALLAGGSSPWWWGKLFPDGGGHQPPLDPVPTTLSPGIGACASVGSPVNEFRDSSAPNGSWDWNCDGQIEREWGPCENLSKAQCDPNTNATGSPAGFCNEIRAPGGCPPTLGECGHSGFAYPCFYNAADGRCHAGGYEIATVMRCR
jgi:hypothetical protein